MSSLANLGALYIVLSGLHRSTTFAVLCPATVVELALSVHMACIWFGLALWSALLVMFVALGAVVGEASWSGGFREGEANVPSRPRPRGKALILYSELRT